MAAETRSILSNYERRRIDGLFDEVHFRELFELASEVCFGDQFQTEAYKAPQDETSRVVAQLGVRGVRCLLDGDQEVFMNDGWDERAVEDDEHSEYLWIDAPLRHADDMGDMPQLHLVHEAKQFGQKLLDTAYKCLGQEAYDKARDFQQASNDNEQMDIIVWLCRRLNEMAYSDRGLSGPEEDGSDNSGFYHPLRLSPLAIGRYPDHSLSPTCLGVSIIAASFFEKAGAEHLHAGVMKTATQGQLDRLRMFLVLLPNSVESKGIPAGHIPEAVRYKIETTKSTAEQEMTRDTGFHASNLIKLRSGVWASLDANFRTIVQETEDNEDRDKLYATLKEYEESAPGLELTDTYMTAAPSVYMYPWVEAVAVPEYDDAELCHALLELDESIPEALYQVVMPQLLSGIPEDFTGREEITELYDNFAPKAFYDCFEKYVLWGDSLHNVRERCKTDRQYLSRRLDDLKNLWIPAMASIAVQVTNECGKAKQYKVHEMLEVGLPAQRIGLAALKDFDTYCGGNITPSFWISHWPSQIPVIESIAEDSNRPGQRALVENHLGVMSWSDLHYSKSHGIVNEFISRTKEDGDAAG